MMKVIASKVASMLLCKALVVLLLVSPANGEHRQFETVDDLWAAAPDVSYSLDHIQTEHNEEEDCWLVLYESLVYDLTDFLDKHPGGKDEISPYCGQEATHHFEKAPHHNLYMLTIKNLVPYLVGRLEGADGSKVHQDSSSSSSSGGGGGFAPASPEENALTARWLAQEAKWGTLTSTGLKFYDSKGEDGLHANIVPFASSRSDKGRIFFYFMGEHQGGPPSGVSLTLSQASLNPDVFGVGGCGTTASAVDSQDPRCAKLTFTGHLHPCDNDASTDSNCAIVGKEALFGAHPTMQDWPLDHNFTVHELHIHHIWMIASFGGGSEISTDAYHTSTGNAPHDIQEGSNVIRTCPSADVPEHDDYVTRARWIAHNAQWSTVSTLRASEENGGFSTFANVRSVVDGTDLVSSTGRPVFQLPDADPSAVDIANGDGSVALTYSEAALAELVDRDTRIPCGGQDAGMPTCAQVTLYGKAVPISDEAQLAHIYTWFGHRHPLAPWLAEGGSHMAGKYYTIELDRITILDFFGGSKDVDISKYETMQFEPGSPFESVTKSCDNKNISSTSTSMSLPLSDLPVGFLLFAIGLTAGCILRCHYLSELQSRSKKARLSYSQVEKDLEFEDTTETSLPAISSIA